MGKGGTKTERVSSLTGGQRELLDQLTGMISGQLGKGIEPTYRGDLAAGPSQLQQQGFAGLSDMAGMAPGLTQAWQQGLQEYNPQTQFQYLRQAEPALAKVLGNYDPASTQQAWQQMFVEPGKQQWDDLSRQVAEKYAGGGQGGGLYRSMGNAAERFQTNQNAQLASMLWQSEQAQNARQLQGIGAATQMAGAPSEVMRSIGGVGGQGIDLMSQILNAGQMQRGVDTDQLLGQYRLWNQNQPQNNPWLNYMQQALGGTQAFMSEPVVTQQAGLGSALMPALGEAAGLAAGLI